MSDPKLLVGSIERGHDAMLAELLGDWKASNIVDGPACVEAVIRSGTADMLRSLMAACPSLLDGRESHMRLSVPKLKEGVRVRNMWVIYKALH